MEGEDHLISNVGCGFLRHVRASHLIECYTLGRNWKTWPTKDDLIHTTTNTQHKLFLIWVCLNIIEVPLILRVHHYFCKWNDTLGAHIHPSIHVPISIVLSYITSYHITLHYKLYYIILYYIIFYYIYYIILYYIIVYYITLHYITLYYIILYYIPLYPIISLVYSIILYYIIFQHDMFHLFQHLQPSSGAKRTGGGTGAWLRSLWNDLAPRPWDGRRDGTDLKCPRKMEVLMGKP